jgi:hypothetical protein
MATYTVKTLISAKAMGNGSANIATWQYQNTGTAEAVARSFAFMGQAGGTGSVTVQIGVTGATSIANQNVIDAYPLTANNPYFVNGWYTVAVNSFLDGFTTNTTTNGAAYGLLST